MITVENVPQCPCGETFPYWRSSVNHADGQIGRFTQVCNSCNKKVYIKKIDKALYECYKENEYDSKPVEINVEKSFWTMLGKRPDGSLYTTCTFENEDAARSFRDSNHFDLIAIGEFKGTFKLFDYEMKRK
jgi:hypothetical protein